MNWNRPVSLVLVALVLPAMIGRDQALASHGVRDQAGLFSSAATQQAEKGINQIYNQFRKELLVEAFAGVPAGRVTDYERDRESFFTSFLQERAREARVDGVYLMILKEAPPHNFRIQVGAGRATRQQLFRQADQDQVVKAVKEGLRSGDYDRALRNAVAAVGDAFRRNASGSLAAAPPTRHSPASGYQTEKSQSSSWTSYLLWAGLILVGVMVISALFRRVGRAVSGPPGTAGMPGTGVGGGGGLFSSLFGGIAGAMAGSWLYDRFFGHHGSIDRADGGWTSADSSGSDLGSDFTSTGADVDDVRQQAESDFRSSGGDVGGGFDDLSGGDFGGDSGGTDV